MSYKRVNWEDFPKRSTPVNAHNLNIMDKGIAELDESKADKEWVEVIEKRVKPIFNISSIKGDINNFLEINKPLTLIVDTNLSLININIPKGVDVVGYNNSVKADNITLNGDNIVKGLILDGGNDCNDIKDNKKQVLNVVGDNVTIDSCVIKNAPFYSIYAEYVENLKVVGNKIENSGYAGVGIMSSRDCFVTNNKVDGVVGLSSNNNGYGIFASSIFEDKMVRSENIIISGNIIKNVKTWEGIDTHGGENIIITDNTVDKCDRGIAIVAVTSNRAFVAKNIIIKNNIITNATQTGLVIAGSDYGDAENISIEGNTLKNTGSLDQVNWGALRLLHVKNISVTNNKFIDSKGVSIRFAGPIVTCKIVNNIYDGLKSELPGPGHIRFLTTNVKNVLIDESNDCSIVLPETEMKEVIIKGGTLLGGFPNAPHLIGLNDLGIYFTNRHPKAENARPWNDGDLIYWYTGKEWFTKVNGEIYTIKSEVVESPR